MSDPVLELTDVSKDYHGLRPLRIASLSIGAGERVSLLGFDQAMAEVFVNLATGVALPERGSVRLFGRPTSDISDSADWLAIVDRFGIVSRRAVLLDALTVIQNLAMPYTLEIEPPPADVRARAVALAEEVGLGDRTLDRPMAELTPTGFFLARLARAIALDPAILLFEHPSAEVAPHDVADVADRCRAIAERRRIATVTLTADRAFAKAAADRVLTLDPATGRLGVEGWWSRFRRS